MTQDLEVKNSVETIIRQIKMIFDVDRLRAAIDLLIRKNYHKAIDEFEQSFELNVNIVPHQEAIDFLSTYTFENIKDMNDTLISSLRKQLTLALLNNESHDQITSRVQSTLKVGEDRARTIARTESHRAYNLGNYHSAQQSGLRLKKEWYNPNPQAAVCKKLAGTTKPLNEPFRFNNEEYLVPPAHPNCRSRILYVQVDE